ncbi:DUF1398 family protein [Ancylobacter sp. FA202]|uniref:DUF1398 family protein n=1 Tax=Ancylobacter sp. FA202 TaxID=1111106 RepID=UPI00035F6419|nr:DUF1398 family protein [Ancylobacter sp. FA202]
MHPDSQAIAAACLKGSEDGTMSFPDIVGTLMAAGFESYSIDFRRATATYYFVDGASFELPMHAPDFPVAAAFDPGSIGAAISEAQQLLPGYTYKGFCAKVAQAGCAGYIVSFSGRRALYLGRTAETHVELFPR